MKKPDMTRAYVERSGAVLSSSGFTLVELMVVVIVVGVLTSMATVGYQKYMDQAKVSRLRAYVLSLASKQVDAMSRQVTVPFNVGPYGASNAKQYQNILGFTDTVYPDITIDTEAWTAAAGGKCKRCKDYNVPEPTGTSGYMVVATQDLNGDGKKEKTTVYMTSTSPGVVEFNVGE